MEKRINEADRKTRQPRADAAALEDTLRSLSIAKGLERVAVDLNQQADRDLQAAEARRLEFKARYLAELQGVTEPQFIEMRAKSDAWCYPLQEFMRAEWIRRQERDERRGKASP
jgi:uncharacterized protein YhaN